MNTKPPKPPSVYADGSREHAATCKRRIMAAAQCTCHVAKLPPLTLAALEPKGKS